MSKYLIHADGSPVIGAVIEIPPGTSSDAYGEIQNRFRMLYGESESAVSLIRLYEDQCYRGVYWSEVLAGSAGMQFGLFVLPGVEDCNVRGCKMKLSRDRDVVGQIKVVRIAELVDFTV